MTTTISNKDVDPPMAIEKVERIFRLNRQTLFQLVEQAKFPAPIIIGECWAWRHEDLIKALKPVAAKPEAYLTVRVKPSV